VDLNMARPPLIVRTAHSTRRDTAAAAAEIVAGIRQLDSALTLVFSSPRHDPGTLARQLTRLLGAQRWIGCTTAGEISPDGFDDGTVTAMSIGGPVSWDSTLIEPLSRFTHLDGKRAIRGLCDDIDLAPSDLGGDLLGLVLVDGLQMREEELMASLGVAAPALPIVGASASDDFAFESTVVFHDGHAHEDAALLAVIRFDVPVALLKAEHYEATQVRVVVTGAVPGQRLIHELDGHPALQRYAELVGEQADALSTSGRFLRPFAVQLDSEHYIRSIMRAEGQSLRFACAVEEGVVLTLMRPGDLVGVTRRALDDARRAVGGTLEAVLAFNCLGRLFEAKHHGLVDELQGVFRGLPVTGFHTYGEQFRSLHVNHTLTGFAIGGGS
jgi:hypothetical protein